MSDITPPPSVAEIVDQGSWPLSKEAQEALVRTLVRGKKLYPRAAFNAALDVEREQLMFAHVFAMIERRAKECATSGETFKVRLPMPGIKFRKRQRYMVYELPITREVLYHIMLGLPPSQIPDKRIVEEQPEEQGVEAPKLLGADGQPLVSDQP